MSTPASQFPEIPVLHPFSPADTLPGFLQKVRYNLDQFLIYASKLNLQLELLPDASGQGLPGLPGYTQPLTPGPQGPRGASFFFPSAALLDGDPVPDGVNDPVRSVGDVAIDPSGAFFDVVADSNGVQTYRFQQNYSLTLATSLRTPAQFAQLSPTPASQWVPKPAGANGGNGSFVLADRESLSGNAQGSQLYDLLLGLDKLPAGAGRGALTVANLRDPDNPNEFRGQIQLRYRPAFDQEPTTGAAWIAYRDEPTEARLTMDLGAAGLVLRQYPNAPTTTGVTLRGPEVLLSGLTADLSDLDPSGPTSGQYLRWRLLPTAHDTVRQTTPKNLLMDSEDVNGSLSIGYKYLYLSSNNTGNQVGAQITGAGPIGMFAQGNLVLGGTVVQLNTNTLGLNNDDPDGEFEIQCQSPIRVAGSRGLILNTKLSLPEVDLAIVANVVNISVVGANVTLFRIDYAGSDVNAGPTGEQLVTDFVGGLPGQVIEVAPKPGGLGFFELDKGGNFDLINPVTLRVGPGERIRLRKNPTTNKWQQLGFSQGDSREVRTFAPTDLEYDFDNLKFPGIWIANESSFVANAAPFGLSTANGAQDSTVDIVTEVIWMNPLLGPAFLKQKQWIANRVGVSNAEREVVREFSRQTYQPSTGGPRVWGPWYETVLDSSTPRQWKGRTSMASTNATQTWGNTGVWTPNGSANFYFLPYSQTMSGIANLASLPWGTVLNVEFTSGGVTFNFNQAPAGSLPIRCRVLQQRGVNSIRIQDGTATLTRHYGYWELGDIDYKLLGNGSPIPRMAPGGLIAWDADPADGEFDGTGLGTGNMAGYAVCNGANGTQTLPAPFPGGVWLKWVGIAG